MAFRTSYSGLIRREANDPTDLRLAQLRRIISTVHPAAGRRLPGFNLLPRLFRGTRLNISVASSSTGGTDRVYTNIDCDEVLPNLFIGDEGAALNKQYLKLIGVTHVVNTAEGDRKGQVATSQEYYHCEECDPHNHDPETGSEDPNHDRHNQHKSSVGRGGRGGGSIKYLGINVIDLPGARISAHFQTTSNFIDRALRVEGGKVLVHCLVGISRSATIVLAYLMIKRGLTLVDALKLVRKQREVNPNDGFLRQLIELDTTLVAARKAAVAVANNNNNNHGDGKTGNDNEGGGDEDEPRSASSTSMTVYCDSHGPPQAVKSKTRKLTN